jgi:hypothetical protein
MTPVDGPLASPFLIAVEAPLSWRKWVRRVDASGAIVDATGLSDADAEAALAADADFNERIANAIFDDYKIQGVFFPWRVGGQMRLWSRISAQVYNTLADYQAFAAAVLDLKARRE